MSNVNDLGLLLTSLEKEVERLCEELNVATQNVMKKGYLFKLRERDISWSSKWNLRYFTLNGNFLSYFGDEKDLRPRRTIDLSSCVICDEGIKKGNFYVFSIYLIETKGNYNSESSSNQLLLRLSCESKAESSQWMDLLEKGCALNSLKEDQNKIKYQLEDLNDSEDDNETWVNTPIETDAKQEDDKNISTMIKRVKSSSLILQRTFSRQSISQKILSERTPEEIKKFGKNTLQRSSSRLSLKEFVPRPYPASKNVHIHNEFSPLSSEVRPGEQNYRGFFNLGVLVLVISNLRLIVDNLSKYGFLIKFPAFSSSNEKINSQSEWEEPKPFQAVIGCLLPIFICYFIEKLASKKILSNSTTLILNIILGFSNIILPCVWVFHSKSHPMACMLYLFEAVVIWMKLISYSHTNRDLRRVIYEQKKIDFQNSINQSDSNIKNVDNNAKPQFPNYISECKDLEAPYLIYPNNINLPNLFWFMIIPTLCYQLNYPRTPSIRWKYVASIVVRMLIVAGLIIFSVEQHIKPTLQNSLIAIEKRDIGEIIEKLLKLSIPNTYVWLMIFYIYFHLWLNFLAELTRFGDRVFCKYLII
jgi:diacylglycerol O-acyltransferase-1